MENVLKIGSNNPLFFRDGNDATFGGDVFSKGLFPPSPTTLYGAIRASFFEQNKNFFKARETKKDPSLDTQIQGFCLHDSHSPLFPLPFDYYVNEDNIPIKLELRNKDFSSNSKLSHCLISNSSEKVETADSYLVTKETLLEYLQGKSISDATHINDFMSTDEITHNALDKNGVVKKGALFVHHQIELEKISKKTYNENDYLSSSRLKFCVKIQNENNNFQINFPSTLMLGSDGKPSFMEVTDSDLFEMDDLEFEIEEGSILKYYLSTPAIYKSGHLPAFLGEENSTFRLLAFAAGRSYRIGGFNTKNNFPKTMYNVVPAGSVYYLEVNKKEEVMDLIRKFDGKSTSDFLAKEGYGIGYFGNY
jgi:CRISPR-associated protein Cmr3